MNKMMLALAAMLLVAGSAFAAHGDGPVTDADGLLVTAHVDNICFVSTPGLLDFTDAGAETIEPDEEATADTEIGVTCTRGTAYRVGLGAGENHGSADASLNVRQMRKSTAADGSPNTHHYLAYTVTHTAAEHDGPDTTRWGTKQTSFLNNGLGETSDPLGIVHWQLENHPGNGEDQRLAVHGYVAPMAIEDMPEAGVYNDTVAVIIYF